MIFFLIPFCIMLFVSFFVIFVNIMIKITKTQTKPSQNNQNKQAVNDINEDYEKDPMLTKKTHTYCSYCAAKIDIDARKCPECGAKIKE